MAKTVGDFAIRCLVLAILYAFVVSDARLLPLHSYLENGEKPITNIFDTSKYGILQLRNGLAQTPQMGWNSWNFFACDINEKVIKETADALVSTGLAKLGYIYVNIDDCWSEIVRDSKGQLVPDSKTFPSGIKALADYVHSKGLKLGIYSDAGAFTCQVRPGSLFHENDDANIFTSWVWADPLSGQRLSVVLWNRCSGPATIRANWGALGLESSTLVAVKDLWKHDIGDSPFSIEEQRVAKLEALIQRSC